MVTIDKGIPVQYLKYPFKEMDIGDSFLVPSIGKDKRLANNLAGSMKYARKKTGFKFLCRLTEGGYRIWRIE